MRVGRTRQVSQGEKQFNNNIASIILKILFYGIIVLVPLGVFSTEKEYKSLTSAIHEARGIVQPLESDKQVLPSMNGELIHFHSDDIQPSELLADHDFAIEFPGAVKYKRNTEYCQWQQHTHDKTYRDRDGNERTERTYTYTKQWLPYRVPSLLFDQPGAHHNPQRDPFPSTGHSVKSARAGAFTLNTDLIDRMKMTSNVKFSKDNLPAEVRPAYSAHNFKYIGNGYFYSAYTPSGAELAAKLFVQYMEGSILDYQIGDLFSHCTAGDIRLYYTVVAPKEVSVVAKQVDSTGALDLFTASNQYKYGFVQKGVVDPFTMFDVELKNYRWGPILYWRLGLMVWGALALYALYPSAIYDRFTFAVYSVILTGGLLGSMWLLLWGVSVSTVFLPLTCVLMYALVPPTPKSKSS